jgi:pyrroloquinoline quinone biosynthesis protein B
MRLIVLGSGAGGGLPQWNCNCANCAAARRADPRIQARTQTSLAVSGNGLGWLVVNASPDLGVQIARTPELWPQPGNGNRSTPIRSLVLTGAEVDHIAGLLTLRERQKLSLWASPTVLKIIEANTIFRVLAPALVERNKLLPDTPVPMPEIGPIEIEAFLVPGKAPLHRESEPGPSPADIHAIGIELRDSRNGTRCIVVPGCAFVNATLLARLDGADLLLFDGTLYRDDELVVQQLGDKTGARMGHISMSGEAGSIAALSRAHVGRRIFIHMNNSNPALRTGSDERRAVESAGWELAYDGMRIVL